MASSKYGVKDFLKSFINVPAWMGAKHLRRGADDIVVMSRDLFTIKQRPVREETFEQAALRFNLSETDILKRQQAFGRLAAIYLCAVFCLGVYLVYLWHRHAWSSVIMTFMLMLVVSSFAFKEHFWYVQMRHRRLGLTMKDWFLFTVGKTKASHLSDQ